MYRFLILTCLVVTAIGCGSSTPDLPPGQDINNPFGDKFKKAPGAAPAAPTTAPSQDEARAIAEKAMKGGQ